MHSLRRSTTAKPGLLLALSFALTLTACDVPLMEGDVDPNPTGFGDGGGNTGGGSELTEVTFTGDIGASGVTNSFIIATTPDGATVWIGSGSNNSDYLATMSVKPTDFPLILRASGGVDLVSGVSPKFELHSVILDASTTIGNINPFSTIISKTAGAQARGINDSSITSAWQVVSQKLNFGLDTLRISDPISSPVQNSNVANLVRSNEALAEMIRRTWRTLLLAGFSLSADQVIAHLSGDLTDGVIDGRGIGADARVAATSSLVSAQILLETMTNDLQVRGFDAEDRMDTAISMTHPGASVLTGDLTAPAEMIAQAALTTAAAYDLSPTAANAELFDAVSALPTGANRSTARQVLPSDSSMVLDASIAMVAAGTASDHEVVNARMRMGLDSNVIDRVPPIISLIGASTIPLSVGDGYVELGATATDDRDGDLTSLIVIDNQNVNTSVVNNYVVSYNVSDTSGNAADELVRTVSVTATNVADTSPPVITLDGANPLNLVQGDSYVEPGATAMDNVDGDISSQIIIHNSSVTTSTAADYQVTYNVSDTAGNIAVQAIRTVSVSAPPIASDTVAPVIRLVGANPLNLVQGDSYVEPGATATDNVDGDISSRIIIRNSAVNTATVGNYQVTYNVSDTSGNAASQATRSVNVQSVPGSSGDRPWEAVLNDMVGFADHYGVTGGAGRQLVTVTNLNNSGSGSLRQAIADATSGAWIRFAQGMSGTINLSSQLSLNGRPNITIDGRGANITIDGANYAFRTTSASANNFIIMYLKAKAASVDLINIDFGHTFWFYHLTLNGPNGDGTLDIRKTIGRWTLQELRFSLPGRKTMLLYNEPDPSIYDNNYQEGTLYRTMFETNSRQPRGGAVNKVHMYNCYSHGNSERSVAWSHLHLDSLPGELLYERNIVDTDNGYNAYMSFAGPNQVAGKINLVENLHLGGAVGRENLASEVFTPPYAYTAAPATTALRDDIISTAGWQFVPFPGD